MEYTKPSLSHVKYYAKFRLSNHHISTDRTLPMSKIQYKTMT